MSLRWRPRTWWLTIALSLSFATVFTKASYGEFKPAPPDAPAAVTPTAEPSAAPAAGAQSGQSERFSQERYIAHIAYLAADELEGRGIGTPGIDKAADYVAAKFKEYGIEPGGVNGTYFQPFEISVGKEVTDKSRLEVAGAETQPKLGEDFVPMPFSTSEAFEGDLVFAGYGIENESKSHNDYAHLDVKGKVVLLFRYEPPSWADSENGRTQDATFRSKAQTAKRHEAAAVVIVNPRDGEDGEDELFPLRGGQMEGNFGIPMFHVKRAWVETLLKAGGVEDLDKLQRAAEQDKGPVSMAIPGVRISGESGLIRKNVDLKNVIGVLKGGGDLADEFVVIGGHYDHLGKTTPMRAGAMEQDTKAAEQIHNGADDNASGTSGVLELAKALKSSDERPRRSVIFMAFTGEETGLHGSKHFADNPTVPIDRIAAMLNMDMIGRMRNNRLEVGGVGTGLEFDEMLERFNADFGFTLRKSKGGVGPSDHTSFYLKNIPVLFFFSGIHRDYHRPSDDVEKINAPDALRVMEYVYDIANELVHSPSRPTFQKSGGEGRTARRGRVRLGIMPEYGDSEEPGMGVDGVTEGPAKKAGMEDGDRILKIGETEIAGVYDLMDAMANFKPGDETDVLVARGDEKLPLHVVFEASRPMREREEGESEEEPAVATGPGGVLGGPVATPQGTFRMEISPVWLGIMIDESSTMEAFVLEGSPAQKAGMEDGDRLLKIGDRKIEQLTDISAALKDRNPGDETTVVVRRGSEERTLKVKLAAPPDEAESDEAESDEANAPLELVPMPVPKVRLGVMLETETAVRVANVLENSAAARAGVKVGDVISAIGQRSIGGVGDLASALSTYNPGDETDVTVIREGDKVVLKVKFDKP